MSISEKNHQYYTIYCILYVVYLLLAHLVSRSFHLRMRKVSDKSKSHILCSITFILNRAVYEVKWKYFVERDRPQMTIWRMHISCWIPKATNTNTNTHNM
jgi:hypothetical protein